MIQTGAVVAIIMATGALVLAVTAFRSHSISFGRGAQLAAIWVVIILGLTAVFRMFGS